MFVNVLDTLGPVRVHGVLTGAMEFRRTTSKTKGEGGVSDGGSPREVGGEMRRRGEVGSGSSVSGKELRVRGVVVDEEDAELPGSGSWLPRTEDSSVILLARGGKSWWPEVTPERKPILPESWRRRLRGRERAAARGGERGLGLGFLLAARLIGGEGAGQGAWGRAAETPRHGLSAPPRWKGVRREEE